MLGRGGLKNALWGSILGGEESAAVAAFCVIGRFVRWLDEKEFGDGRRKYILSLKPRRMRITA